MWALNFAKELWMSVQLCFVFRGSKELHWEGRFVRNIQIKWLKSCTSLNATRTNMPTRGVVNKPSSRWPSSVSWTSADRKCSALAPEADDSGRLNNTGSRVIFFQNKCYSYIFEMCVNDKVGIKRIHVYMCVIQYIGLPKIWSICTLSFKTRTQHTPFVLFWRLPTEHTCLYSS